MRVRQRVALGGHNIPDEAIQRRFRSGVANMLNLYLPLAQEAEIYDNTEKNRILVAGKYNGGQLIVHDPVIWNLMREAAACAQ